MVLLGTPRHLYSDLQLWAGWDQKIVPATMQRELHLPLHLHKPHVRLYWCSDSKMPNKGSWVTADSKSHTGSTSAPALVFRCWCAKSVFTLTFSLYLFLTITFVIMCCFLRTLFPTCKKVKTMLKKIEKAYVTDAGYFEFGPLLFSKTRDRWGAEMFGFVSSRLMAAQYLGVTIHRLWVQPQ